MNKREYLVSRLFNLIIIQLFIIIKKASLFLKPE